jgi:zinc transporter
MTRRMLVDELGDSNGLLCAYDLDGQGSGRKLDWAAIDTAADSAAVRWIHLNFSNPKVSSWLRRSASLDPIVAEAMLSDDSRPRVIEHGAGMLVILRGVNTNPGAEPEDMVSLRIWLERGRVISTRRRRLLSVGSMEEDLKTGEGPKDAADFLVKVISKLDERIEPVIDRIDEAIEEAEVDFTAARAAAYRGEFSGLRRQAMRIRRFLAPQRTALEQLSRLTGDFLSEAQRFELREEAEQVTRYLESLDLVRERAMVAQEELIAQLAQQQNSRMYILSIVAAIFLPLSFLTGLMGMNVAGLPGTEDPASFTLLVILMLAVGFGIVGIFRWQKWL